eukprot:1160767-Pelagomonas_calceolata.AAC.1
MERKDSGKVALRGITKSIYWSHANQMCLGRHGGQASWKKAARALEMRSTRGWLTSSGGQAQSSCDILMQMPVKMVNMTVARGFAWCEQCTFCSSLFARQFASMTVAYQPTLQAPGHAKVPSRLLMSLCFSFNLQLNCVHTVCCWRVLYAVQHICCQAEWCTSPGIQHGCRRPQRAMLGMKAACPGIGRPGFKSRMECKVKPWHESPTKRPRAGMLVTRQLTPRLNSFVHAFKEAHKVGTQARGQRRVAASQASPAAATTTAAAAARTPCRASHFREYHPAQV